MGSQGIRRGGPATLLPPLNETEGSDDLEAGYDWDNAVLRSCACGYVNTERGRCPACGAKDPDDPTGGGRGRTLATTALRGQPTSLSDAATGSPTPARRAGSKALWMVVGTVALNIVQQVVVIALITTNRLEAAPAMRLSLLCSLGFYSLVALWVLAGSARLGVRPVIASGHALTGAAEGAVVGGGLAIVLVAGAYLATGHPVLDPFAAALTNQSVAAFVVGAVLIALVAPVVEELVFRGFLAEALRPRGRGAALIVSAAAFSVAHLRFAQFRYYVALGLVLGGLYWQRGLVASVTAHACFNGMLIVAALAASHGPPVTLTGGGASITVPAAWHTVGGPKNNLITATGPSGATIELVSIETGTRLDPQRLAANLGHGEGAGIPGISIDASSVALLDLPAGPAVSMAVTVGTRQGRAVMFTRGTELWVVSVETAGSARAATDFQESLNTLQLPAASSM